MTTTPSTGEIPREHAWRNGIHTGQGTQEYCERCGVRKGDDGSQRGCQGKTRAPAAVRSDYDPFRQ